MKLKKIVIIHKCIFFAGQRAEIESLTSSVKTREGKKIRLVCKVNGQPPPKITWFKDKVSIKRKQKGYKFVNNR